MLVSKWKPSGGNKLQLCQKLVIMDVTAGRNVFGKNLMAQVTRVHLKVD